MEREKEEARAGRGDVNAETDRMETDRVQTDRVEDGAIGAAWGGSSDVEGGVGTVPDTQDSLLGLVKDNKLELFNTASDDDDNDTDMSLDTARVDSACLKRKKFKKN